MALGNGSLVRCVKHPSHLSTGFCSLCLLERLATVGLTKSNTYKTDDFNGDVLELSIASPKFEEPKEKPKTTLRDLFELADLKSESTNDPESKMNFEEESQSKDASIKETNSNKLLKSIKNGVSTEIDESQESCSVESPREAENQLKRSSSLRCACEWISCCNNCESIKKSYSWSKVWDNSIIIPLGGFARKQSNGLKRSLSESCKDRKLDCGRDPIANMDNLGADSQKKEWKFGRSLSLHCSSSLSRSDNGNKGFLRFYFAPLKRRGGVNKNMKKKKGLFGIFGFYDLS
ncbi:hypothetical protein LUZ60_016216 [Juncus effusus]|nr:hypothetical protein LUZ60_016216 [Juncus effusus]